MKTVLVCLGVLYATLSFAQYRVDIGAFAAAGNYLGEIGGRDMPAQPFINDLRLEYTRAGFGFFARYQATGLVAVNATLLGVRLQAADSLTDYRERFSRNLSFRNDIVEATVRGELHWLRLNNYYRRSNFNLEFNFWTFLGIGVFYNNPRAYFQGTWHNLRALNTEGPGREYSAIQPVIPIGYGFSVTFLKKHRLQFTSGWSLTFTDYIDDISTTYADPEDLNSPLAVSLANRSGEVADDARSIGVNLFSPGAIRGNPDGNDSYFVTTIGYSYLIPGGRTSLRTGRRRARLRGGRARF